MILLLLVNCAVHIHGDFCRDLFGYLVRQKVNVPLMLLLAKYTAGSARILTG